MNLQYKNYKTKKEYVYQYLNEKIFTGKLKPGLRLEYNDIAKILNVSLNPVREAMHQLEINGLVKIIPRQGAYVAMHSEKYLTDMYDMKIDLEAKASTLAVANMDESDLIHLEYILKQTEEHIEGDLLTCALLNKEFHTTLCSYSDNLYLMKVIDDIWANIFRYSLSISSKKGVKRNLKDHYSMLRLIENKEVELLESLIKEHQITAKNKVLKIIGHHLKG